MDKKEIDRIGALNFIQKALLMHSLTEKKDMGTILVRAKILGDLNKERFEKAWNIIVNNHEALRTSIHWENVSKPLQVVHKHVDLDIEFYDHSNMQAHESEECIPEILSQNLVLSKAPVMRVVLLYRGEQNYLLLWQCHHILVDGWSSGIVLEELINIYCDLEDQKTIEYEEPTSMIKALNDSIIDEEYIEKYWRNVLKGYNNPKLFGKNAGSKRLFHRIEATLNVEKSDKLRQLAKNFGVSLNTLFQSCWILIMQKVFDSKDVIAGITFSGRLNPSSMEMTKVVGMLMNVLPLRINSEANNLKDFFQEVQQKQSELVDFEKLDLDKILYYNNWSSNLNLFDNLVVFENFPNDSLSRNNLKLTSFESEITTSFNLNFLIRPSESIHYSILYNSQSIDDVLADEIVSNLKLILDALCDGSENVNSIKKRLNFTNRITSWSKEKSREKKSTYEKLLIFDRNHEGTNSNSLSNKPQSQNYEAPANMKQVVICQIWEDLFGFQPVGISDDFFELGGTSMMAVQLFSQIERNFQVSLPPTTLINNPTIRDLESVVSSNNKGDQWVSLVPLRKSGNSNPLFCLHAGGAHVFFYNDLAKHLGSDQPVYAIQPVGLENIEKAHSSIEEMSSYYISEMKKVQPKGPYSLLGTCFSDAVALEIALQLKGSGEEVNSLIIVDSEPLGIKKTSFSNTDKLKLYMEALRQGKFRFVYKKFGTFLKNRILGPERMIIEKGYERYNDQKKEQLKNLDAMRRNLSELYESYTWKKYDQNITFIQSEDFGGINRQQSLLNMWRQVIDGEIMIHTVKGHHLSIFQEPAVKELADKVMFCLKNKEQEAKIVSV